MPASEAYAWTEGTVGVLIVLSIGLLVLEGVLPPDAPAFTVVRWIDVGLLVFFALELTLRVLTFRPPELDLFVKPPVTALRIHVIGRLRFLLTPFPLIDLLTVLALVPALRGLRALRLLRLIRAERVFRHSNPFSGLVRAFEENRILFAFAFSFLGLEVLLGGVSIYLVEGGKNPALSSVADGIWWALVTLTTVGFGDIVVVTALGRIVGGVVMIAGMFTLALFAGIVGQTLLHSVLSVREEQFRMSGYVGHVVVCGYGEDTRTLLRVLITEFEEEGAESPDLVLFAPMERPPDVPPRFVWVRGDPTKDADLDKVRLSHAKAVVIPADRTLPPPQADARTLLVAFTVRAWLDRNRIAPRRQPIYIIAEILEAENAVHARTAGADEVIQTHLLGFSLLAHAVRHPGTADTVSGVALAGAQNVYVGRAPQGEVPLPASFAQVATALKQARGALLLGFREPSTGNERINPPLDLQVPADAELVYLAVEACLEPK